MEVDLLELGNVTMKPGNLITTTLKLQNSNSAMEAIYMAWEGAIVTVILVILCIFGLVANAITFCTIISSNLLRRSPFNILILSLSISDFLSALHSPLQIYRSIWGYLEYKLSIGACKICASELCSHEPHEFVEPVSRVQLRQVTHPTNDRFVTTAEFPISSRGSINGLEVCQTAVYNYTIGMTQLTMFVTIQHILVFSLFRLLAILFPHKIKKFTPKWAKIVCIFIWIEVFLAYSLFYIITATVVPYKPGRYKTACTAVATEWRPVGTVYVKVALPIMLFAPFIVILLCTIVITGSLIKMRLKRGTTRRSGEVQDYRQEQENAALIQVTLIVFSFLLGYTIDAVYRMTKALDMRGIFTLRGKWMIVMISYVCLRFSECLNPIFYNLASSQMRESTKKFLRIQDDLPSTGSSASAGSKKAKSPETPI